MVVEYKILIHASFIIFILWNANGNFVQIDYNLSSDLQISMGFALFRLGRLYYEFYRSNFLSNRIQKKNSIFKPIVKPVKSILKNNLFKQFQTLMQHLLFVRQIFRDGFNIIYIAMSEGVWMSKVRLFYVLKTH